MIWYGVYDGTSAAAVSGSESARMPVPMMEAGPRPVRAGQPRCRQDPEPEASPDRDRQPEDAGSRGAGGRLLAPGRQGPQGGRVPAGK